MLSREQRRHHVPRRVRSRMSKQEHDRRPASAVLDAQRRPSPAVDALEREPLEERHRGHASPAPSPVARRLAKPRLDAVPRCYGAAGVVLVSVRQ